MVIIMVFITFREIIKKSVKFLRLIIFLSVINISKCHSAIKAWFVQFKFTTRRNNYIRSITLYNTKFILTVFIITVKIVSCLCPYNSCKIC